MMARRFIVAIAATLFAAQTAGAALADPGEGSGRGAASNPAKAKVTKPVDKPPVQPSAQFETTSVVGGKTAANEVDTGVEEGGGAVSAPAREAAAQSSDRFNGLLLPTGLALLFTLIGSGLVWWMLGGRIAGLSAQLNSQKDQLRKQSGEIQRLREAGLAEPRQSSDGRTAPAPMRDAMPEADPWPPAQPAAMRDSSPLAASIAAPPRVSQLPAKLGELRDTVSRLMASPGLRGSEYDAAIAAFGSVWGIAISADGGSARLIPPQEDPNRRLCAVLLEGEGVAAIVPSSRYIKDFAMTFKESLEAGEDVKIFFDCQVDGTAAIRLGRAAQVRVSDRRELSDLTRGALSGFVG